MMAKIMSYFSGAPVPMALFAAHFLLYALLAWPVLAARAARRRMNPREVCLLAIFAGSMALEFAQLGLDGFDFSGGKTWGLPRYFGVFAPLLWIWAARALAWLWGRFAGWGRLAARAGVCVALVWVFASQNVASMRAFYGRGARHDALVAARRIAPVIRADYKGPPRQAERKRTLKEYFTTRRPVVFGDFSAAAWMVRGQSEGALQGSGACPYDADYLFIRAGSGYAGSNVVDSSVYEYVRSVRGGLGTEWRLFRRRRRQAAGAPPAGQL